MDCRAEMASKEGIATRSADRPSSSSTRPMNHIHDSKDVERFTTKRKEGHRTSSSRARGPYKKWFGENTASVMSLDRDEEVDRL